MRSTGEVMAGADDVSQAYARVLRAAGRMRRGGRVGLPLQAVSATIEPVREQLLA